jgi:hypothetical protein
MKNRVEQWLAYPGRPLAKPIMVVQLINKKMHPDSKLPDGLTP